MDNITKSESISEIAKALVKFHQKVGIIKKGETNPFFKSKYANLPTILKEIDSPLQEAGLSYVQFPVGKSQLTTLLMHGESGQWIQGTYEMTPSKNDPQGIGSAITYMRRYAVGSILGLSIDEDDDGNKAAGKSSFATPGKRLGAAATTPTTPAATVVKTPPSVKSGSIVTVSDLDALEAIELAIHDAENIDALNLLLAQIPKSRKLTETDKARYTMQVQNKIHEFDPLA